MRNDSITRARSRYQPAEIDNDVERVISITRNVHGVIPALAAAKVNERIQ